MENALLVQAQQRGVRVAQLESADVQLTLFDSMNTVASERYLRETLAGLLDGSLVGRAQRAIGAWRSGDAVLLHAVLRDTTTGGRRNGLIEPPQAARPAQPGHGGADQQLMGEGGVLFVGVGLLLLLGDSGVPHLLAQRAYLVERVY